MTARISNKRISAEEHTQESKKVRCIASSVKRMCHIASTLMRQPCKHLAHHANRRWRTRLKPLRALSATIHKPLVTLHCSRLWFATRASASLGLSSLSTSRQDQRGSVCGTLHSMSEEQRPDSARVRPNAPGGAELDSSSPNGCRGREVCSTQHLNCPCSIHVLHIVLSGIGFACGVRT